MKKTLLPLLLLLICSIGLQAQNIKKDNIEYFYIKLPGVPVGKQIKNYQSEIIAAYEEENQRKLAEYEADKRAAAEEFERDKEEYPARLKAAELKYEAEMEEWKKKSVADKLVEKKVLGEDNKPVKNLPRAPYLRNVSQPQLKTTYDYSALAATYLKLEGFENNATDAIKITVTLYGFDYTPPQQMTNVKKVTSHKDGKTTTTDKTFYYTEFTYRHPMAIQVTDPSGKVLLHISPQELNSYKTYKTNETEKQQQINHQTLIKTYEEKILQENLAFLNDLVNDQIGYAKTKREADLYHVRSKGDAYNDLMTAYNEAASALKFLADNQAEGSEKMKKAIQIWNTALSESSLSDKKARINKDVTIAIYFNLLEANFAMQNYTEGERIINLMNSAGLSNRERKQKEEYEALFMDLKKRVLAQK